MSSVSDNLTIPLYNNSTLIKSSIEIDAISDLIDIINNNPSFQDWILDNIPSILKTLLQSYRCQDTKKIYKLADLFTFNLDDDINLQGLPVLDLDLIERFTDNVPEAYKVPDLPESYFQQEMTSHFGNTRVGVAYGGAAQLGTSILGILGAIFITRMFSNSNDEDDKPVVSRPHHSSPVQVPIPVPKPVPKPVPDKIKVLGPNDDNRRIVMGVQNTHTNFRFCVKYTNNSGYIDQYKKEAKVYRFFSDKLRDSKSKEETHYLDKVVKYYGSGASIISNGSIKVTYHNPVSNTDITIRDVPITRIYNISGLTNNKHGFYMCTEWIQTNKFTEYSKISNGNIVSTAYSTIISNLGYLNHTYGFYHADLHRDNVFVSYDGRDCKFFVFDFSGVIGEVNNTTFLDMFGCLDFDYDDINTTHLQDNFLYSSAKWKNFFYFFDVYRLYIAVMITLKDTNLSNSPLNTFVADNKSLRLPISSIHKVLYCLNNIPTSHGIDMRRLSVKIKDKLFQHRWDDIFNNYYCALDISYYIYNYLTSNRLHGVTEKPADHLGIPSIVIPHQLDGCTKSNSQQQPVHVPPSHQVLHQLNTSPTNDPCNSVSHNATCNGNAHPNCKWDKTREKGKKCHTYQ